MGTNREQFVVDQRGNRTAVLIDIERYAELLEAQEELEAIRAYDQAKASKRRGHSVRAGTSFFTLKA